MFNKEIAEQHLNNLLKEHNITVKQWSVSSCGWAMVKAKEVKIPKPLNIDKFCVGMHEL